MKANIKKNRNVAFVITLDKIKSIWDLLQNRIGPCVITVNCEDSINREFDNWKSFSNYENARSKEIKHLSIRARSKGFDKLAKIEFSSSIHRLIDIDLDATEAVVSNLYDDISDILDGTEPWYSKLVRIDFFYVVLAISFIGSFYINLDNSTPEKTGLSEWSAAETILAISVLSMFMGLLGIVAWALNKVRAKYFPVAYFAVGQGVERYEVDEKVRWTIIVSFVVSLSASAVFI